MSRQDKFYVEENMDIVNAQNNEQWQREEDDLQMQQDFNPPEQEWDELERQSLSALNQFTKGLTKIDIKEMADSAIENLLISGNVLQIGEALAGMQLFIDEVKGDKRFTDYIREEILKNPKGFVSKSGAKIEAIEAGTKYDFSQCDDLELRRYEAHLVNLTERIKKRKEFLKTIPASGLEILVDDELVKIFPPSKTSTSSYRVTLSKGF